MKLEIHVWKHGRRSGALAIDLDTGVAAMVASERLYSANQKLAIERLEALLREAVSPGMWVP